MLQSVSDNIQLVLLPWQKCHHLLAVDDELEAVISAASGHLSNGQRFGRFLTFNL